MAKRQDTTEAQLKAEKEKTKAANTRARAEAAANNAARIGSGHAAGFINFVREQGVIGLAVGLAIGVAAGASVKSIVDNFINPIVGFVLGGRDLSSLAWNTGLKNGSAELIIGWGAIVSSLITLAATALVMYLAIHAARLDRLDKAKE